VPAAGQAWTREVTGWSSASRCRGRVSAGGRPCLATTDGRWPAPRFPAGTYVVDFVQPQAWLQPRAPRPTSTSRSRRWSGSRIDEGCRARRVSNWRSSSACRRARRANRSGGEPGRGDARSRRRAQSSGEPDGPPYA
jgi:hypothetical protein